MRLRTVLLAWLLAGAGCATAPPVELPQLDVTVPETWATSAMPPGQINIEWWNDFDDPNLSAAVITALERNYDLQAAAARLEQAAADVRIASADLHPSVQTSYMGSHRKQNFVGFPIPGAEGQVLSTVSTNQGVSLDVSWELDLWGRLRANAQASLADLQRSSADLRGAQLSLAGQTVKAWFAIAEAQQQVDLSRKTVASFRESADVVRKRFEAGIRPALDLRLALLNFSNAKALLQQRLQQFDAVTRQLEVLLGAYADGTIGTPLALPTAVPDIPTGLPADLVGRRPDLVAAERQVAVAEARLEVARTELLPRITLTGATGRASDSLRDLIGGDFSVWSILGNVVEPLWQGGRLRVQVSRAEARAAEVLATYTNTALHAYAEVETALAAEDFLEEREINLEMSVEQARAAERLANERYLAGLETYITVLDSQRSAVQAEADLIAARWLRLENRVDLYLALGGGFEQLESPFELGINGDNNN